VDSGEGEILIFIRKRKRTARSSPSGTEQPPPAKKAKTERNEVDPLTPNVDLIYSLRRLMHVNRVSQKQVAKDLRVSESTLSAFMNEKSRISGWIEFEDRVRKWLTAHGEHMIDYELEKNREYSETNRLKLESQLYSGNHFTNIHPEVQQQLASSFTSADSNNYSQSVHLQPYRVNLQNGFSADEHSYNHESMHSTHAPNMSSMNSAHQQHMNSAGMTAANNVQPNYYHSFVPPQHQFNSVHGNFNPMYPVPHMPTPLHLVPTPSYPPQFFDPLSHGHSSHSPYGFKPDSSHMHSASNSLPLLAHMNNLPHPNPYQANTSAPKGNFVANNMQQTSSLTTMISQSTNSTNHTTNSNPASAPNHNQFPFSIQPTLDTRKNGSSFGMSPSLPFAPPAPVLSSLSSYSSATSSAAQQMTASPNFDRQLPPVPRMMDPLLNRPGPAFMPPHPRPSEIWK
jgi:transcriptional regulator with XRE-family HTH domain